MVIRVTAKCSHLMNLRCTCFLLSCYVLRFTLLLLLKSVFLFLRYSFFFPSFFSFVLFISFFFLNSFSVRIFLAHLTSIFLRLFSFFNLFSYFLILFLFDSFRNFFLFHDYSLFLSFRHYYSSIPVFSVVFFTQSLFFLPWTFSSLQKKNFHTFLPLYFPFSAVILLGFFVIFSFCFS